MQLKKKGYFFIIDALFGLAIIVIGTFLITSSYIKVPQSAPVGFLADDLLTFLSNKKIKDLNNPYAGVGGDLWSQGLITDEDNSLLQQIGIFYKINKLDVANDFINSVTIGVMPSQYRYEVLIDDTLLYPQPQTSEHIESRKTTDLLLTSKQIAFGVMNTTTSEMFGPFKAEVFVWEK